MNEAKQHEEQLFEAARQLKTPGRRHEFLKLACDGDPEMFARLRALVEADSGAEEFFKDIPQLGDSFENLPVPGPIAPNESVILEGPGARIGRYKLLQRIGEGGCGVVYLAEQEEPVRRRVALKIIKLGMDTKSVIARFEAERQALAMMDHPNIARVLDAGATDTGRPYFVMELVRGVRITDFCDHEKLNTRRRLDLFIQICRAIQHAHQKGIIHRDIKPSNILVTMHDGVPVPKVIDFGIAKATEGRLADRTLFTAYEQFIGTPAYMSPEQADMSGLDVDTRSDIYSLGVLLYELLTGKTPFDATQLLNSGFDEIRRTLREREPQKPSTMVTRLQAGELMLTARKRGVDSSRFIALLRGDLDWIVMKALEKDRKRRYETANGLALDVQRHLDHEPVLARPPSRIYRLQRLVRRNRATFVAVTAVTIALISALGTSTWLFVREKDLREQAVEMEKQQNRLRLAAERQAQSREKLTQIAVFLSQSEFEAADDLLSALPPSVPTQGGAAVFRVLGDWHALHGRWQPAAEHFSTLVGIDQFDDWEDSTIDLLKCGCALLESGDRDIYEHFRLQAVARYSNMNNPVGEERVVKISLLFKPTKTLLATLEPMAALVGRAFGQPGDETEGFDKNQVAWGRMSLALWAYRIGDYSNSVTWCQRCLEYDDHNLPRMTTAHIVLAMAYNKLGREDIARSELSANREIVERQFQSALQRGDGTQGFWFDWVFARILLREATSQVEKPVF